MMNSGVGLAIPMIPGKAARGICFQDDIGVIGAQYGVIALRKASLPDGAMKIVFLVDEKFRLLEEASHKISGL
ncbi:hypothetical protein PSACC_03665 [Paramicrosporidium saccamoebae]|uniref:Uncharacterized protein n=1 Tax=Paramicrosporidium saccamoebae TaxID=1246581 RepID=A0A2H9TFC4_9FUNG|nr:hypothetical protein PSACC_03665 [Paramicrosporidium saccamoebae]